MVGRVSEQVLAVCLFNSALELGQYFQYLLDPRCEPINALLREYFADQLSEPKCLSIRATTGPGTFVLAAAAAVSTAAGLQMHFSMRRTAAATLPVAAHPLGPAPDLASDYSPPPDPQSAEGVEEAATDRSPPSEAAPALALPGQ